MIQHTNKVSINTIFSMWPSKKQLTTITIHLNGKNKKQQKTPHKNTWL